MSSPARAAPAERAMRAGPLSARVAALCDAIGDRVGDDTGQQVRQVRRRLDEPLRVAVAGRLKAGKSTLVNALIGRRVAPTDVGECTRVVTRFRYGSSDRVDVVRRDGGRTSLPLDETGMVPGRLGVSRAEVAFVDVTLTSDRLRDLTVLDTPGLASTDEAADAGTRRLLTAAPVDEGLDADSAAAIGTAESVIYVFTQAVRADDVRALEVFRSVSSRLATNPINSVGVLNKADKLAGGTDDPWPVAGRLADEQTRLLRQVLSDVVPLVGLLAETTQAGRLTAADCAALRTLAGLPPSRRRLLTASVDLFTSQDAPVSRPQRQRLLRLLDLYGIGFALAQLAAAPDTGSGELVRLLGEASGLPRLRHTLDQAFGWRTDAIKAGWAVSRLDALAGQAPATDREVLRDGIEQVLRQPEYHRLRLLEVAQRVSSGAVELPEPMRRELVRLALSTDAGWILDLPGADTGALVAAARQAAARWRVYAVAGAGPAQSRVAQVAHRGFHLLSQRVGAEAVPR